jgi:hypothetical protein
LGLATTAQFNAGTRILRRLRSARNDVALVFTESTGQVVVLKEFRRGRLARDREALAFRALRREQARVPAVRACLPQSIITEYIDAESATDWLDRAEAEESPADFISEKSLALAHSWTEWLCQFRHAMENGFGEPMVMGDVDLSNFLVDRSGSVWGVDFEDCHPGEPAADFGWIGALILSRAPAWTAWKRAFVQEMIRAAELTGPWQETELRGAIARALVELEVTRGRSI